MADSLKSRTGCLTCLARKKKCDEALPKCSHCQRLGLACVSRNTQRQAAVSATNLKNKSSALQPVVSNGYPAFTSSREHRLCLDSPRVLDLLVSEGIADKGFKNVALLGRFCTQSKLVREAVVAFAAYGLQNHGDEYYKLSLKSYQSCVSTLQKTRAYESDDSKEKDFTIIAIMFLGLLEALFLGDPSASVAHFEMCRKLLATRVERSTLPQDAERIKLYRMAAECIIYNFASLSPFHETIDQAANDWGASFSTLFPSSDHTISPFLGGADFQELYQIMFLMNVLLRHSQANVGWALDNNVTFQNLWERLDKQENKVTALYPQKHNERAKLYRAKYQVSIHALRIHLIKIWRPTATTKDSVIRYYLTKSIAIIREGNVYEDWNPALRWPLTILACASDTDLHFNIIMSAMDRMMERLDLANSRRLQSAQTILRRFRKGFNLFHLLDSEDNDEQPDQLDFLLEPRNLDSSQPSATSI